MKKVVVALAFTTVSVLGTFGTLSVSDRGLEIQTPLSRGATAPASATEWYGAQPPCDESHLGDLWWDSAQQIWWECKCFSDDGVGGGIGHYYDWVHA